MVIAGTGRAGRPGCNASRAAAAAAFATRPQPADGRPSPTQTAEPAVVRGAPSPIRRLHRRRSPPQNGRQREACGRPCRGRVEARRSPAAEALGTE